MDTISKIYQELYEAYGKQGWWPITPIGGCKGDPSYHPIYGISTKNEKQKLEIIFGAILTQNTSWKNVEKAIVELNKKNLIDIDKILKADQKILAETIKSSGYFNQKAKALKNIALFIKEHPIKELEKMPLEKARPLLLEVKGIGPETADSILLYTLNKPIFVIDAYTKRIFSRIGICKHDISYNDCQELFMKNLDHNTKMFNEYHALIVEHAKQHCMKKPVCENCPIEKLCKKIGI